MKKIRLQLFLLLGFISSSLLVGAQVRVVDNKGTVSTIDPSKWTRIGIGPDIFLTKYPGNVGIGLEAPEATLHNAGSTILGLLSVLNELETYSLPVTSVKNYSGVVVTQTVSTSNITLPAPDDITIGRLFTLSNASVSTHSVSIAGSTITLEPGQSGQFVWTGIAWSAPNASVSVSNTSAGNALSTTVNHVIGANVNIINSSVVTNPTVNTVHTMINGVGSSTDATIIGSNTLTAASGSLESTVNGVIATIPVTNGLTASSNSLQLGGSLTSATAIATDVTNTLAITGLGAGLVTDAIVVSSAGVLKTITATALPITGDITGTLGVSVVSKIQGTEVSAGGPADGQFLQCQGGKWIPATISPSICTITGQLYDAKTSDETILADAATITLPDATSCKGKKYNIKNIGTGAVTVKSAVGTIDGLPAVDGITGGMPWQGWIFQSNGENWYIISRI